MTIVEETPKSEAKLNRSVMVNDESSESLEDKKLDVEDSPKSNIVSENLMDVSVTLERLEVAKPTGEVLLTVEKSGEIQKYEEINLFDLGEAKSQEIVKAEPMQQDLVFECVTQTNREMPKSHSDAKVTSTGEDKENLEINNSFGQTDDKENSSLVNEMALDISGVDVFQSNQHKSFFQVFVFPFVSHLILILSSL